MRKWIMSACMVLAWSIILPTLAAAALTGPGRPTQANTSSASNTRTAPASTPGSISAPPASQPAVVLTALTASPAATWTVRPGDTLTAIAAALAVPGGWHALYTANQRAIGPDPNLIRAGTVLVLPATAPPARYTVTPGDTLSAIAAALAVPGGWHALYTANRHAIGPDPNLIRAGTVLTVPRPAARSQAPRPAAPAPARHPAPQSRQAPPTVPAGNPTGRTFTAPATAPAGSAAAPTGGGMPRWLEDVLLAAGLLGASAFAAEPAAALARRRRARHHLRAPAPCAAARARIILADHERLIVTYCTQDDTVYVLTPPGEDPRAVLRAARLVLPQNTYEQLAGHLGVPSAWPCE